MPKFSILILTHNRLEAVRRCFESLAPTLARDDVHIMVLDNASTDGTREYLSAHLPKFIYLMFPETNLGVAGGRAALLNRAIGDYIVFLDSDTVIADPNWLDVLDKALEPESVGIVGPGGSFVIDGWEGFTAGRPGEVDCVAGYCVMFKAELLKHGLTIDTTFEKFWSEDSDFAFQIRDMGYDVICCPVGILHTPAHSGYGQEAGLHDANFDKLRRKWQGKGIVKCESGY